MNTQSNTTRTQAGVTALGLASLTLGLTAVMLLPAGAALAAPRSAPQLSIAVDDHHTSVSAGDTLSYAIIVKNLGGQRVTGLRVSQTVPAGLKLRSASAHGVAGHGQVSWRVTVKPGGAATLRTTMKVQHTPQDLLRLASVACAGVTSKRPVVCATDSDQLPAGAAAAGAVASGSSHVPFVWIGGLAGLAVVVGGAGALLLRRRRDTGPLRILPRH